MHGHLLQGLRTSGKSNFVELLRRWLIESNAPTIGDIGDYGRRPWLLIEIGSEEVVVNADTSRSAVKAFVEETVDNPERPWRVVANRRGHINKINPRPAGIAIPGWYAYLSNPRSEEGVI